MAHTRSLLAALASLTLLTPVAAASGERTTTFTHGIASGEVTATSVVVWTRLSAPGKVVAEIALDRRFERRVDHEKVTATAAGDFTAKVSFDRLAAGRRHYFRFRDGATTSPVGTFVTAPGRNRDAKVRFVLSGDSDGTLRDGRPAFNRFEVLDAARREQPDFFVYLGDTIYADSEFRARAATTVPEYQEAYRTNRDVAALRDLMAATSTYAVWDDHEVVNDYDGQTVDPARYRAGRQAFLDWMPVTAPATPTSGCAGSPFFRTVRWGRQVELFILDERSCRSADAAPACVLPGLGADAAPTLPGPIRAEFAALLPPVLAPTCLPTINDPSRTLLGAWQKQALKDALTRSNATFKFVVNELSVQATYALPYDRWEGYAAERTDLLRFIRDQAIENVVFLTTDEHRNVLNEVSVDPFTEPTPVAYEAIVGPIATNTFAKEVLGAFPGPLGLQALGGIEQILTLTGTDCRDLDRESYALVEVDPTRGTATIALKDRDGAAIVDRPLGIANPAAPCAKTIVAR